MIKNPYITGTCGQNEMRESALMEQKASSLVNNDGLGPLG
jgi:hypothetical protein